MDCLREYWLNDPHINSTLPPRLETFVFTCSLLEIILVVLTNLCLRKSKLSALLFNSEIVLLRAKKK